MAEDLRHHLAQNAAARATDARTTSLVAGEPLAVDESASAPRVAGPGSSESQPARIVPKGLRSFDAHDADFFLALLPGPRDRDGLPESIRFWKARIEEKDADNTFSVGLVYGPSGCGKSSLVKAGLLPRLSRNTIAVYVEATANETEARLLNGLRKRCPELSRDTDLRESLATLRRGRALNPDGKVLIVLDQFEQWLHAKRAEQKTRLVQALRQCDGAHVQCLVMLRDDFWMAATRFMRELEIRIVEGHNSAPADLFDVDHARKVVVAFGRAFGRLPQDGAQITGEQERFLDQAVAGLADEGKVICVRLARFAEMMKGKPWTPTMLREAGGTDGIRVTFLEETFSAPTAPPEHRYHQGPARAVLQALLPDSGTDIKGHMRSFESLLQASGYANRRSDFEDLIRILDNEVRLITPTDPDAVSRDSGSGPAATSSGSYYQLTHDYLVPSLREWLAVKSKQTWRGRAQLRLADRAAEWKNKPDARHLPAWWEFLNIRCGTRKTQWTPPQRRMMHKAGRYHGLRCLAGLVVLVVAVGLGLHVLDRLNELRRRDYANGLVRQLLVANTGEVPDIIAKLDGYRQWADPTLRRKYQHAPSESREKLHAGLALLPVSQDHVDYLCERLLVADPDKLLVIREALRHYKDDVVERFWAVVQRPAGQEDRSLRAAVALADYAPADSRWKAVRGDVVEALQAQSHLVLASWMNALRPVKATLLEPLCERFVKQNGETDQRAKLIDVLADYAADEPITLARILAAANSEEFIKFFDLLEAARNREVVVAALRAELDKTITADWGDTPLDPPWTAPVPSLVRKIEAAQGLLDERSAFCQTMPLDMFLSVAEELRKCGYRPLRFRPYSAAHLVHVAAVWNRDGREWKLAQGLTAEDIRQRNAHLQKRGFQTVDVAGYLAAAENERDGPVERYGALWVKKRDGDPEARMFVGVPTHRHDSTWGPLYEAGFKQVTNSTVLCADKPWRHSEVWMKVEAAFVCRRERPAVYSGGLYPGSVQVHVEIIPTRQLINVRDYYSAQLAETEDALKGDPEDPTRRLTRATAYRHLAAR